VKLLLYLAGCALWALAVRGWRPELRLRDAAGYALLAGAFLAPGLGTAGHQTATDLLWQVRPWKETVAGRVEPANPLLSDPVLQMLPFRTLVRERLLAGEAPLWAHELGTGQPLLGNAQSAPFAPFHLAALPLPPLDGMQVAAGWQLFTGALLAHCLLLALGARPVAAAVAAVGYGLSCFAVVWLFYPIGMAAAWLPGVVLGVVALSRGEPRSLPGLLICTVAMAASGHPETLAHAALVCGVLAAVLAWCLPPSERLTFAGRAALAALLAAAISLPVLGPVLEALPESQRTAVLVDDPGSFGPPPFEPRTLLPLLDPFVFGSPRDGDWAGPWNFNELVPVYAGLVTTLLALFGALWRRGRALAVLAGGTAALLASHEGWPFGALLRALPLLEHAAHSRLRLVWVLAVAVAAGLTVEELARRGLGTRSAAALGVGALALAGAVSAVPPLGGTWQLAWWWGALAGLVLLALAALVPALRRRLPAVALALVALDLVLLGARYNPALGPEWRPSTPPALATLAARSAAEPEPHRVVADDWDLPAGLPAMWGLWDPRGNDPMRPAAAARHVARRLESVDRPLAAPRLRPGRFDPAALDDLAVRYRLTPHRRRLPPPWRLVADRPGGRVWHDPAARGLFFPAGGTAGDAEVTGTRAVPNGFDLRVHAPAGATIGSSVSSARAWRVRADGEPIPTAAHDGAFLAFTVPPGRHAVELRYAPATWRWGLVTAGGGLLLLAVLAARRRREAQIPLRSVASTSRTKAIVTSQKA